MRLTTAVREAFVASVMADVPKIDYVDRAHKLINKRLDETFLNTTGVTRKELIDSGWIPCQYVYLPDGFDNAYLVCPGNDWLERKLPDLWTEISALGALKVAQEKARDALREKIYGVALSVATTKALSELLPEFVKYLPPEPDKSRLLPAVSNVVADFMAAGWPKSSA